MSPAEEPKTPSLRGGLVKLGAPVPELGVGRQLGGLVGEDEVLLQPSIVHLPLPKRLHRQVDLHRHVGAIPVQERILVHGLLPLVRKFSVGMHVVAALLGPVLRLRAIVDGGKGVLIRGVLETRRNLGEPLEPKVQRHARCNAHSNTRPPHGDADDDGKVGGARVGVGEGGGGGGGGVGGHTVEDRAGGEAFRLHLGWERGVQGVAEAACCLSVCAAQDHTHTHVQH
mmetsp:Transcript_56212/g.137850  ORF Transcript_56212/g.137850 Transcript_56212/m.137850 type:complete len:227 (-) Transcript_56212:97-777(-)